MPPVAGKDANGRTLRVLVTGFGPFGSFEDNPSWLAVEMLKNESYVVNLKDGASITTRVDIVRVPVVYDDVLSIVPGLHTAPPILPEEGAYCALPPPADGYDFVMHVGVGRSGPLAIEMLGHKTGYNLEDYNGKYAPIVDNKRTGLEPGEVSFAEAMEQKRLGIDPASSPKGKVIRGFGGRRYALLLEALFSKIDVESLADHLKEADHLVRTSNDPGRYLCDFIYYCSLAEAQIAGRETPVLFVHCPPIGNLLNTDEVADGVRDIIKWVCKVNVVGSSSNI